jgi:histidinol-phosphate aminotransferase
LKILDKVRPNIRQLKPYSSARDEFSGNGKTMLDANENAFGSVTSDKLNRYPDPRQTLLKEKISAIKNIDSQHIFLGNGSDEAIDLLIRAFCEPGLDSILIHEPTYGMYRVCADINNTKTDTFLLDDNFQLNAATALSKVTQQTKIIFLCSPNNPSGNLLATSEIIKILDNFDGLVVVDEAYIDFCPDKSISPKLHNYENLVILNTFSKAWGLAGLRLGMAFAHPGIIEILNNIKYPYNINDLTAGHVLAALENLKKMQIMVGNILEQRKRLNEQLKTLQIVQKIYPSDSNFLLVRFNDCAVIFNYLREQEIIVRDRSRLPLCENCLRITVGTDQENKTLISALKKFGN